MTEVLFGSDNTAGVSPAVMQALIRCDQGRAVAYGDDAWSAKLNAAFSEVFERETFVVCAAASGTAANALGLAAITPGYGETLCHREAHILTTEGGAPEFFAGGSRLVGLPGADGKIPVDELERTLTARTRPSKHHLATASLSLTQSTEAGTVYALNELQALCTLARGYGVRVHMDGARFSNALVALDASPADVTWRAGVDVLSLGTTKNGTMNAEAVIVFDAAMMHDLLRRQKRSGLLTSKMRYVSAQLLAFLEDDLWLRNARRANATARHAASLLEGVSGIRIVHPVQTNQVFADIPPSVAKALAEAGVSFRTWDPERPTLHRLIASFQDGDAEVARLKCALEIAALGGI